MPLISRYAREEKGNLDIFWLKDKSLEDSANAENDSAPDLSGLKPPNQQFTKSSRSVRFSGFSTANN